MLSEYRYRKAREIVKSARIGEGGKRMLFCALRQYRKNLEPRYGLYQKTINGKKTACLVGAALADVFEYKPNSDEDWSWYCKALNEFGVWAESVKNLIVGFDHWPGAGPLYDRSRYAIVGQRLRKLLIDE